MYTIENRPPQSHGFYVARIREIDQELGHQAVVPLAPSYIAELNERRAAYQADLEAVEAYIEANPGTPAFIVTQAERKSEIRWSPDGKILGVDIEDLPPGKEWEVVPVRVICPLTNTTVLIRYPDLKLELECYAADVYENHADAEASIPDAAKRFDDLLASFGPEFDAACVEVAKKVRYV